MGCVWAADHLTLHVQIAVKFMSAEVAQNEANRSRFAREAAAASQVRSPHVVQMLDHGISDQGLPFIAMELLDGEDLATRLQRKRPLETHETAWILGQVCKAVSAAHARGIIHRDIKPENIFLCDAGDGEVFAKVLDFGIAKGALSNLGKLTSTGQALGTPYYMSPEAICGTEESDPSFDLWALGVVAFEMLVGHPPFLGNSMPDLILAIHAGPIPVPSAFNPRLPKAFDEWFARACSRDRTRRFANASELCTALHAALAVTPACFEAMARCGYIELSPDSDSVPTRKAPFVAPDPCGATDSLAGPLRPIPPSTTGANAAMTVRSSGQPPRRGLARSIPMVLSLVAAVVVLSGTGAMVISRANSAPKALSQPEAALSMPEELDEAAPSGAQSASAVPSPSAAPNSSALPALSNQTSEASLASLSPKKPVVLSQRRRPFAKPKSRVPASSAVDDIY